MEPNEVEVVVTTGVVVAVGVVDPPNWESNCINPASSHTVGSFKVSIVHVAAFAVIATAANTTEAKIPKYFFVFIVLNILFAIRISTDGQVVSLF
jgi:hypothetical protein